MDVSCMRDFAMSFCVELGPFRAVERFTTMNYCEIFSAFNFLLDFYNMV